ncbi:hypothetical protein IWX90DRAFT_144335 [Phyllosticta citrichinensis]|uniref:Uncharacterized protein n=1 Tax=Phyllosticta citrichinensis TaxID=1130410 RepID=A0ABR1XZC6_9PEZI
MPSTMLSRQGADTLALPSQMPRLRPHRQHLGGSKNHLKLPSLPRFHPANFPSQSPSQSSSSYSSSASPPPPPSPRSQQKQYSEAQRQLYFYQRDLVANAVARNPLPGNRPMSPRLNPLGSPGPVTPLELEGSNGDYLLAGASTPSASDAACNELVEKLMLEEAKRAGSISPSSNSVDSC